MSLWGSGNKLLSYVSFMNQLKHDDTTKANIIFKKSNNQSKNYNFGNFYFCCCYITNKVMPLFYYQALGRS